MIAPNNEAATTLSHKDINLNKKPRLWWQNRTVTIILAVLGLLAVLVFINLKIMTYETHLASGETVLLELAPVDPRGFMQGDYMTLSYALEREVLDALDKNRTRDKTNEGYVIVALDKNNVGHFVRLADDYTPDDLATNEKALHYRLRNGSVMLATNAFFFQEGHGEAFEAAEYGQFRVNDKGEPLLTNLVNEEFEVIDPNDLRKAQIDNQLN